MSLSTLLDSVPQVPSDYSNHMLYGGLLGAVCFGIAYHSYPLHQAMQVGAAVPFVLCGAKKVEDYIVKHETLTMCVSKTIVTALLPALFLAASYLK